MRRAGQGRGQHEIFCGAGGRDRRRNFKFAVEQQDPGAVGFSGIYDSRHGGVRAPPRDRGTATDALARGDGSFDGRLAAIHFLRQVAVDDADGRAATGSRMEGRAGHAPDDGRLRFVRRNRHDECDFARLSCGAHQPAGFRKVHRTGAKGTRGKRGNGVRCHPAARGDQCAGHSRGVWRDDGAGGKERARQVAGGDFSGRPHGKSDASSGLCRDDGRGGADAGFTLRPSESWLHFRRTDRRKISGRSYVGAEHDLARGGRPLGERMSGRGKTSRVAAIGIAVTVLMFVGGAGSRARGRQGEIQAPLVTVHPAAKFDVSPPLRSLRGSGAKDDVPDCKEAGCGTSPGGADADQEQKPEEVAPAPVITAQGAAVEQKSQGKRAAVPLLDSLDGLGSGFTGPQGTATFRNPSDNSLAVGPDHIVQIVNTRIAVYSKKGAHYDKTGTVLYGPAATNAIFTSFGGACEARDNGDAVVRYDQLAKRWLIVMPIFGRIAPGEFSEQGKPAPPGGLDNPGPAVAPPANPPQPPPRTPHQGPVKKEGTFAMCYAVSVGPDPLGAYYRYAFER